MAEDINAVIGRVDNLPAFPRVVRELSSAGDLSEVDLGWLSGKISLDQAISVRLLRLANSSFYGLPSRVASVEQAVPVLGIRNVQAMLITCALLDTFATAPPVAGFDYSGFWRHSMATAVCARTLARRHGCDQAVCFTIGMLHDIGKLAMCIAIPDRYAQVIAQAGAEGTSLAAAELAQLGFSHAEVGQRLARHWQLPPQVCNAVGGHHLGPVSGDAQDRLITLTAHADALAHALGYTVLAPADASIKATDTTQVKPLLASLGYDEEDAEALCVKAAEDIADLVRALLE